MENYCFEISANCYLRIKAWDFWEAVNRSKSFIDVSNLNWHLERDLPKGSFVVLSI